MGRLELTQIHVTGTPRELGRGHGETLRDRIQAFVAHRLDAAQDYLRVRDHPTPADFAGPAAACLEVLEDWDPDGYAEHVGTAEAADVDPADLYAATNYSDTRDLVQFSHPTWADLPQWDEGCTAFALPADRTGSGRIMCGQTWDLHERDLEYVVAIHRTPADGPETWSVTCCGSPSLIGMNEHGLYVGTTNIKIRGVRPGICYLSLLHRAIRCQDRLEAAEIIQDAPRVAAHTYWMVDDAGAVELECSATTSDRRDMAAEPILQTNHCLSARHQRGEAEPPHDSSLHRLARARTLLVEQPPSGGHDVESLRRLMEDRAGEILAINRYPEDGGYATTNACVIAEPGARRLWACRGPADRGAWVELPFSRVTADAAG